jgi:hypothetical protein
MSHRSNRLSLRDLAGLRKPLVQTAEPDAVEEVAPGVPVEVMSVVPSDVPPDKQKAVVSAVPIEVPLEVPLPVPPRILQERKIKKRLVSQSFKLPVDLDDRWSRIASFNDVTKTGILLEALETFLARLPQPPDLSPREPV